MADRYYRLVIFVVNICPQPLRKIFVKMASSDNTLAVPYTDLHTYLQSRQQEINTLRKRRILRHDQRDLLLPNSGNADESKWDVSLLICLLKNLFSISIVGEQNMDEIREVRNNIQHYSRTSEMSNSDFEHNWSRLEDATLYLAQNYLTNVDVQNLNQQITDAKINNMPKLGDVLRNWFEGFMYEMKITLEEIKSNTASIDQTLQGTVRTRIGPAGEKTKRMKTVDDIMTRMEGRFTKTIRDFLPDNFEAPSKEAAIIKTNLRDKNLSVVTGSRNTSYLAAALSVIKEIDVDLSRCVEIDSPSDWRTIEPSEVDLVLFRDPFGSKSFDDAKARDMADMFDSILSATNDDEKIVVLFVSDHAVLTTCKQMHDHELLDEVVSVYEITTEEQPADLTFGCMKQNLSSFPGNYYLKGMTDNFIKHYSTLGRQLDKDLVKNAKKTFKERKAVVLVGSKEKTDTVAAVLAASSYETSRCLLLTKPDEVSFIDQNVCLVIIEQFAGNYNYNENAVYDWYSKFDHLSLAVKEGKINIIITCEKEKLEQCRKIYMHPLLDHTVDMPGYDILKSGELVVEQVLDPRKQTNKLRNNRTKSADKNNAYTRISVHTKAKTKNMKLQDRIGTRAGASKFKKEDTSKMTSKSRNQTKLQKTMQGKQTVKNQASSLPSIHSASKKQYTEQLQKAVMAKAGLETTVKNTPKQQNRNRTIPKRKSANGKGEEPIHVAAKKFKSEQLLEVLQNCSNVNVRDNAGWTALHEACYMGRLENARHLLDAKAYVNVEGPDNDTPLHEAAARGHQQVVELLLSRGANPELRNSAGQKPIDLTSSADVFATLKAARPL